MVFAMETIDAGTFVVAPGEYHEFSLEEAARLIACGAATDPDKPIEVPVAEVIADVAELVADVVDVVDAEVIADVVDEASTVEAPVTKGKKK